MIKIKYSVRPFIKTNGQVAIKVRWNSKQCEVSFITGVYADPGKWDEDSHKAKRGTIHTVRNMSFAASEINERIADFKDEIDSAFSKCSCIFRTSPDTIPIHYPSCRISPTHWHVSFRHHASGCRYYRHTMQYLL